MAWQNPVGRLLAQHDVGSKAPARWSEVVGVADDVLSALNDGYPAPTVYFTDSGGDRVIARAKASEADAIRQIRFSRRLAIAILGSSALIGLALAAIGLYGVISYALSQRIREFSKQRPVPFLLKPVEKGYVPIAGIRPPMLDRAPEQAPRR